MLGQSAIRRNTCDTSIGSLPTKSTNYRRADIRGPRETVPCVLLIVRLGGPAAGGLLPRRRFDLPGILEWSVLVIMTGLLKSFATEAFHGAL